MLLLRILIVSTLLGAVAASAVSTYTWWHDRHPFSLTLVVVNIAFSFWVTKEARKDWNWPPQ